jgi:hypothetical protein
LSPIRLSSSPNAGNKGSHWYPTENQLKTPADSVRAMKQVLDQFYALQDQHDALKASHAALQEKVNAKQSGPPPGSGPSDTMLCGLRVTPVDADSLANGATLTYVKATGQFTFQ